METKEDRINRRKLIDKRDRARLKVLSTPIPKIDIKVAPVPDSQKWLVWSRKRKEAKKAIAGWKAIRVKILDRDGYVCRICGVGITDCSLDVHHKDWDRSNNAHKNLVALCSACHRNIHFEGYKPSLHMDYPEPWGKD